MDFSGNAWGVKTDGSITGLEFYSAPLSSDAALEEIKALTDFSDSHIWEVDTHCGFHLHLDMEAEERDGVYAIAYAYRATESVWAEMVADERIHNSYCHPTTWSAGDLEEAYNRGEDFYQYAKDLDTRFCWLNLRAYLKHGTIEIRLHQGTLDYAEITHWVRAHLRFADWASALGWDRVKEIFASTSEAEKRNIVSSILEKEYTCV
jgi:Putative amidoligase enzyme